MLAHKLRDLSHEGEVNAIALEVIAINLFSTVKQAYIVYAKLQGDMEMDWTDCPLVEVVPGKVSGVPILKGTRVQADSIVENYEGGSPVDEISENFDIPEAMIRTLLDFASEQQGENWP